MSPGLALPLEYRSNSFVAYAISNQKFMQYNTPNSLSSFDLLK